MALRFNAFTGTLDFCGSASGKWVFNPFTGKLDRDHNTGGFVFNPFTGLVDSIGISPVAPDTLIIFGTGNALEWGATDSLRWGN